MIVTVEVQTAVAVVVGTIVEDTCMVHDKVVVVVEVMVETIVDIIVANNVIVDTAVEIYNCSLRY